MFSFLASNVEAQDRLWRAADRLAFGAQWKALVEQHHGQDATAEQAAQVLGNMFGHGSWPKGLVPFHMLGPDSGVETAFEAHLRFWSLVMPKGGSVWFSVQEDAHQDVENHIKGMCESYGFRAHLPIQSPFTDTPMLDATGDWVRDERGELLKRPGGHGALLPLLEEVTASYVVIRNIDNAPSPNCTLERVLWTRAMLAEARRWDQERKGWMNEWRSTADFKKELVTWLNASGAGIDASPEKIQEEELKDLLTRPMRLVGMVKNEGQPGGGPFWAKASTGSDAGRIRPQIVESVEFNADTASMLESATHFNPVEMVCVLQPGQSLEPFVDPTRYLQTIKQFEGEEVRVLEHPGLWNGGMSGWLTRFVEIPSSCFQPVKSALDLIGRA